MWLTQYNVCIQLIAVASLYFVGRASWLALTTFNAVSPWVGDSSLFQESLFSQSLLLLEQEHYYSILRIPNESDWEEHMFCDDGTQ